MSSTKAITYGEPSNPRPDTSSNPYRTLSLCEDMKSRHGSPVSVRVVRYGAWRWWKFAGGRVRWGAESYRVLATPWFSFWWRIQTPSEVEALQDHLCRVESRIDDLSASAENLDLILESLRCLRR